MLQEQLLAPEVVHSEGQAAGCLVFQRCDFAPLPVQEHSRQLVDCLAERGLRRVYFVGE